MSYTLFSMTERTAGKPHHCIWCGERIAANDKYLDERSVYDGDIQHLRWHHECRADAEAGWNRGEDNEFTPYSQERPTHATPSPTTTEPREH